MPRTFRPFADILPDCKVEAIQYQALARRISEVSMVPVLDKNLVVLMPCSEKRARKLMERREAKPYWRKGIFCIILQREPSGRNYQDVVVAIDPGSKRTGVTAATRRHVVLNMLFNTPHWVKDAMELRKILRRGRRTRKTPYRPCRSNRKIGGVPPSTKARWGAHLRVVDALRGILPVTDVVIEDIKAKTIIRARQWNVHFSPLEVGKRYFDTQVQERGLRLHKFPGVQTAARRQYRDFKKTSRKLDDRWDAHNVDSHCLAELCFGQIKPFYGIHRCDFMQWHRRQLHVMNFTKGHVRRAYGGTVSLGVPRGTLVRHPVHGLTYIGGTSKGLISLHDAHDGARLSQNVRVEDCALLAKWSWRCRWIPSWEGQCGTSEGQGARRRDTCFIQERGA